MKSKITRIIISSENTEFKIGSEVYFHWNKNNKTYCVIGAIKEINEDTFVVCKVELDKMNVSDELTIKYTEVEDGIMKTAYSCFC